MNNKQLADTFSDITHLLEIKGEVIFKILAYRKAAETLAEYGRDVNDVWREGKLREIPGVGEAIAEKLMSCSAPAAGIFEKLKREIR